MLNTKRQLKDNVYNGSKSRSKSIYRGDQSHTVSMHLRIDNEVSPDKIRLAHDLQLQHKYSYKQNKIQAFRESLKMTESGNLGKRTQRDELETRSSKKLTINVLETQRPLKQANLSLYRKESGKSDKENYNREKNEISNTANTEGEQIAVNFDQLKDTLIAMKKLSEQNIMLKKQLAFLNKNKPNNSVFKALLR